MRICIQCRRSFSNASLYEPQDLPFFARGPLCLGCADSRRASYKRHQQRVRGGDHANADS